MKKNGFTSEYTFKKVYEFEVGTSEGYIAFSHNTSNDLVDEFREAYKKIRSNGTYERILRSYR